MNPPTPGPAALDTHRLLLSNRDMRLMTDPFTYGYLDDYLDPALFAELSADFPETQLTYVAGGSKTAETRNANPAWFPLFEFLSSAEFLRDLDGRFGGILGPDPERRFVVRFKTKRMKSGEWLDPHTDSPTKAITFILYFGSEDWKPDYGGGTDIYEPKSRLLRRNRYGLDVPFSWMNLRDTIDFVPNRLSFVVKSNHSWHGIAPVKCPPEMTRNRLRFTLDFVDQVETAMGSHVLHSVRRTIRRGIRLWAHARDKIT